MDLRDGNQALIVPMSLEEKLEFFRMLVKIGFKEIEVGFPAASDTEYEFLRTLIEKNMIPEDVTVQVLTQCRDHIIRKTFEAVKGRSPRGDPLLQFHLCGPARAGVPQEQGGDQADRHRRRKAGQAAESGVRGQLPVRVQPRRASPAPRWTTPWMCATPCWTSCSPPRTAP